MAMATAVAAAGLVASVQISNAMGDTRRRVIAYDEAKRLAEALMTEFQESGGNPLAPHRALTVDNNTCLPIPSATEPTATIPACDGQDRIRVTAVRTSFTDSSGRVWPLGSCEVTGVSGRVLHIRRDENNDCSCLFPDSPAGRGNSDDEPSPFSRSTSVLVRESDGVAIKVRVSSTVSGCSVLVPTGGDNPSNSGLAAGSLVPVTERVFFTAPDPSLPGAMQLRVWTDTGTSSAAPDGEPSLSELSLVADHVYSFQITLGYDAGDDGDLLDRAADDDEWVGNAPNDTRPAAIADDRLLRMVGVGVVVGDRAGTLANPGLRIFDGPAVTTPGIFYATATTKVAMRNLNISVP